MADENTAAVVANLTERVEIAEKAIEILAARIAADTPEIAVRPVGTGETDQMNQNTVEALVAAGATSNDAVGTRARKLVHSVFPR